ncbi:uncharacterized protein LOC126571396 [Anopheles aquasalis]|uniref:uncharacterized protein LOC126571396 n=1 Tax=Anopheles aquasalis TaxID=42839 RepID=UPI00215A976D|nr:uncharacterized protein LOC126571396 [Anopheles aquasalis]
MSTSGKTARNGRVQFTKTSCYLCSEWLSDEEVEEHLQQCSRSLETCPEGCGLLVLRKDLAAHRNRCTDGFTEPPTIAGTGGLGTALTPAPAPAPVPPGQSTPSRSSLDGDGVEALLHELRLVQHTLGEEVHYRADLLERTVRLGQRLELANQWTIKVNDALVSLNKLVNGEIERRNVAIHGIEQRQKLLESWQRTIMSTTDWTGPSTANRGNRALGARAEQETDTVASAGTPTDGPPSLAARRWSAIAAGVLARGTLLRGANPDEQLVAQLVEEQSKTSCRVQEALQQTFDATDRLDRLERQVERYRRETYYTKQRLDDLQTQLLHEANLRTLGATDGRIVWRIGDFEQRFADSRQQDIMMKGPLFTNQPFGYVLQLEVSLYGIGTWRGRNVLVGLTVLNGPNDPLLEWPCRLPGTVTLRDQPDGGAAATARDFSKPILAKRQSQHYTRQQFVYIPHETLRSQHYIRDDAIFLEVVLDRAITESPSDAPPPSPSTSAAAPTAASN